jgi:hypothetical protein
MPTRPLGLLQKPSQILAALLRMGSTPPINPSSLSKCHDPPQLLKTYTRDESTSLKKPYGPPLKATMLNKISK